MVQLLVVGRDQPAINLKEEYYITASAKVTVNTAQLSGVKTVSLKNDDATFTDLKFSVYGSGFVLQFTSNHGHMVRDVFK